MGNFFTIFSLTREEIIFFGRIFTYASSNSALSGAQFPAMTMLQLRICESAPESEATETSVKTWLNPFIRNDF